MLEHGRRRIHGSDGTSVSNDAHGGAGEQPRPGTNVKDLHARHQAGVAKRDFPEPRTHAKSYERLKAVIVGSGPVEEPVHPGAAVLLALVIAQQGRMGCASHRGLIRPKIRGQSDEGTRSLWGAYACKEGHELILLSCKSSGRKSQASGTRYPA